MTAVTVHNQDPTGAAKRTQPCEGISAVVIRTCRQSRSMLHESPAPANLRSGGIKTADDGKLRSFHSEVAHRSAGERF
jgi:hypothetical protein